MAVIDNPLHDMVRQDDDYRYGCNSKPRPVAEAQVVGAAAYGLQSWPFANTTDCRHDRSLNDPPCQGCPWQGQGEAHWAEYRKKL